MRFSTDYRMIIGRQPILKWVFDSTAVFTRYHFVESVLKGKIGRKTVWAHLFHFNNNSMIFLLCGKNIRNKCSNILFVCLNRYCDILARIIWDTECAKINNNLCTLHPWRMWSTYHILHIQKVHFLVTTHEPNVPDSAFPCMVSSCSSCNGFALLS